MHIKRYKYWFFILPVLIPFIVSVLIPALVGIGYSFTDWNGMNSTPQFIGIGNYLKLFEGNTQFLKSFLLTFCIAVISTISVNVIGFLLALLVTRGFKGASLLRAVYFMPNLIGGLLLGFTWQFIFVNVLNELGKQLDISAFQGWLSTPGTAAAAIMIVYTWQCAGYMMIIYIAGLQGIPQSCMEAAKIDGATSFTVLRKIIIPMVSQSFTVGMFLSTANAFKMFDTNLALTNGGPFRSSEMMALGIYTTAFRENKLGYAQSQAVIFLIVIAVISLTQLYFNKKREVEL